MKIFSITIIFLCIVIYFSSKIFIEPVTKHLTGCLEREEIYTKVTIHELKALDDKIARINLLCSSDISAYVRVKECAKEAKLKSFLGDWIVNDFPIAKVNMQKILQKIFKDHNQLCADQPIEFSRL